jgi:predicted S18 family serine protease
MGVDGVRAGVALLVLLLVSLSWTTAVDHRVATLEDDVAALETDVQRLETAAAISNASTATGRTVVVPVLAYDTSVATGRTIHVTVTRLASPGLYLDAGQLNYDRRFQASLRTARRVAENASGGPPAGYLLDAHVPAEWTFVGGHSGSLPLALAISALRSPCRLNESVVSTGRLAPDGRVDSVEKVATKAVAARRAGKATLLVPAGQHVSVEGIRVVTVRTFRDAVRYALVDADGSACSLSDLATNRSA